MAPTIQQATTDPSLCQRPLDTHRQVCVSLFWGHCSFLLGPDVHQVLFVPPKSLFAQSCVSSGGSTLRLKAFSSKSAYAIPISAAPRALAPAAIHCWPIPPQETLKHCSVSVSVGSLGPGAHKVCLRPLHLCMKFDSKHDFTPCTSCWGFSFALGHGTSPHRHSSAAQTALQCLLIYVLNKICIYNVNGCVE